MEEKKSIRQEELLKEEGAGTSENHKKTSISKYAIIFILLLALFSAGAYCAIQYYAGKKFREKLDTVTMGTELSVKWKKVRYGIISGDLSVSGVMVSYKYVDMNIDSVTISDISSLPSSISLKIKNIYIKMPPEFGNKFRINPSILAIDTIRGSMSIHLSNDGEFTKMFVDEAHFENIGSFRGTLVLGEMKKWPQSLKYMMSVPIKEGSFTLLTRGSPGW